jgi:membrane-associated phospholipid phosphatase
MRLASTVALKPDAYNVACWVIVAIALVAITALSVMLLAGHIYAWEIDLTLRLQSDEAPEWLRRLTAGSLADPFSRHGAAVVAVAVIGCLALRRPVEALLILVMLLLRVPAHFPKAIVDRDRPSEDVDGIAGRGGELSFTSGHAEWTITFYGFLAVLAIVHAPNAWSRVAIVVAYIAFVVVSAYTRINGGHHWPLDIVGGWIVGIGLLASILLLRRSLIVSANADEPSS